MDFNYDITCTDRNGVQNQFKYSIEESDEDGFVKWIFRVRTYDLSTTDFYEFAITAVHSGIGKVTMMNNRNMMQYKGKGITEKMIEESARVLGLTIISSANKADKKVLGAEYRTPQATAIWERLRNQGLASYDEDGDFYTFLRQKN